MLFWELLWTFGLTTSKRRKVFVHSHIPKIFQEVTSTWTFSVSDLSSGSQRRLFGLLVLRCVCTLYVQWMWRLFRVPWGWIYKWKTHRAEALLQGQHKHIRGHHFLTFSHYRSQHNTDYRSGKNKTASVNPRCHSYHINDNSKLGFRSRHLLKQQLSSFLSMCECTQYVSVLIGSKAL